MRTVAAIIVFTLFLISCSGHDFEMPYTDSIEGAIVLQTDVSGAFLQKVKKEFSRVYAEYQRFLPLKSKRQRPITITVFNDADTYTKYQQSVSATKSEHGFYQPDRGELVLYYHGDNDTLRTLAHEAFHVYFQDRIIKPPVWLDEGCAEYMEVQLREFPERFVHGALHSGWVEVLRMMDKLKLLPNINEIVDNDFPNPHALREEEYAIAWSLVHFLVSDDQKDAFDRYMYLLYEKRDPQRVFYRIWPNHNELTKDWHAYIRNMYQKNMFRKLIPGL